MQKIHLIAALFLWALNLHLSGQVSHHQPPPKPAMALLGVFHFAGTSDLIAIQAEDLTSAKRQQEIKDLVNRLAAYKPTKILIEHPYGDTAMDSLYQLYLGGKHRLSIHESQQIGFRLAKQLGHAHIYPADHRLPLPFKALTDYMQASGQMDQLDNMVTDMKKNILEVSQKAYNELSLSDYFALLNSDAFDAINKNMYLQYTNKMGDENNPVGTTLVAKWWERNLRIMHNIDQITEAGDRILLIFGQGHTAVLKDFYKSRNDVTYEAVISYLK